MSNNVSPQEESKEGVYSEQRRTLLGEEVLVLCNQTTGRTWFLRGECDGIALELNRRGRPITTPEVLQLANDIQEGEAQEREVLRLTRGWPTKEDQVRLEPRFLSQPKGEIEGERDFNEERIKITSTRWNGGTRVQAYEERYPK